MNILSPLDNVEEIRILAKAGATEFFCGYAPDDFINKYNRIDKVKSAQISINKRESLTMNSNDISAIQALVNEAHKYNCKLFVTMNSVYFPNDAYKYIRLYINELVAANVDGVVVADLGMVNFIAENYPDLYLILSCAAHPENSLSTKFYKSLGVNRVTFAHHSSLDEICKITKENPDMEYEAFVLEGRCVYDLGRCNILHGAGHFCRDQWQYEYYPLKNKEITYDQLEEVYKNEMEYNRWTKMHMSTSQQINGWKSVTCAICSIPKMLKQDNLIALKIAGRGCTVAEKVTMVRTIKRAINLSKNNTEAALKEYGKKVFGLPELCDKKIRCLIP